MALNRISPTIDHAGQVLDPAEPVGERRGGLAPREHEGDPQRDGRGGIADVVDGVGEQRDAAGQHDDDDLQAGGDRQDDERPFDRPDAPVGGGDGRIDYAVGVAMATIVTVVVPCAWPRGPSRRNPASPVRPGTLRSPARSTGNG